MSENQETSDYGISDEKAVNSKPHSRKSVFRLKNRMLGDYDDGCFIFGQIDDTEFKVIREPVVALDSI